MSFLPLLEGRARSTARPSSGTIRTTATRAARRAPPCARGDWKLIEFFEDGRLELYNLREDLGEQTDLAAKDPARVRKLHGMLVRWREEMEAVIPAPNPDYNPADWGLDPTE